MTYEKENLWARALCIFSLDSLLEGPILGREKEVFMNRYPDQTQASEQAEQEKSEDLYVVSYTGSMTLLDLSDEEKEKEDDSHLHSIHVGAMDFARGIF